MWSQLALAAALIALLPSCSTVTQKLDPSVYYKRDMSICVGGQCWEGAAVLPEQEAYQLDIKAKGQMDLFTLTSCHRDVSQEKLGDHTRVAYAPVPGMEDGGGCPIELGGYEKVKGRHSWGFVDLEDPGAKLPASLKCNGQSVQSRGVSVCQSREGLLESITFPGPVEFAAPKGACALPLSKDGLTYVFALSLGECVYAFMERAPEHRIHRLTTIGYQSILIREQ